jgi:hypothetical protein
VRSSRTLQVARAVGGALGLALAVVIVLAAWPSASADGLTATVRFSVLPSAELAVMPPSPQPVLVAKSMRPGGNRAVGGFDVHNQTDGPITLAFRARRSSTALDGLVQVRLSAEGQTVARTSLQGMRHGIETPLQLASGATRRIRLEAWMPATVGDGYEGQQIHVSLIPSSATDRVK